jgi:hypothetical protein
MDPTTSEESQHQPFPEAHAAAQADFVSILHQLVLHQPGDTLKALYLYIIILILASPSVQSLRPNPPNSFPTLAKMLSGAASSCSRSASTSAAALSPPLPPPPPACLALQAAIHALASATFGDTAPLLLLLLLGLLLLLLLAAADAVGTLLLLPELLLLLLPPAVPEVVDLDLQFAIQARASAILAGTCSLYKGTKPLFN